MWRKWLLVSAAAICGCQTPFGFGGDEWDDNVDDPFAENDTTSGNLDSASTDDAGGPKVLAAHAYCAEGEPAGIAALVDGTDVWVTHVGFSDECASCASWSVDALTAGTDVTVVYSDFDTATCDCDCAVQGIEYVMTGFTSGTWTLAAGDDSTSFAYELVTE
jgi:hypothetical protein